MRVMVSSNFPRNIPRFSPASKTGSNKDIIDDYFFKLTTTYEVVFMMCSKNCVYRVRFLAG